MTDDGRGTMTEIRDTELTTYITCAGRPLQSALVVSPCMPTHTMPYVHVPRAGLLPSTQRKERLALRNSYQDILTGNFKEGKTGNQILADSRKQAIDGGITPSIYTHPIGFHGHAAGTTIGMWDMQEGVPFTGDYPMHYNTAYSIELNASVYVIEWKKEIRIQLEEDGYFDETGFRYIDGRQTELIVIPKGIANGK